MAAARYSVMRAAALLLLVAVAHAQNPWEQLPGFGNADLYDVEFADGLTGTVVGDYCGIRHTTDGGQTWVSQIADTNMRLRAISYVNDSVGVTCGGDGIVLVTRNAGALWSEFGRDSSVEYLCADMLTPDFAVVGGYRGSHLTPEPLVTFTTDGWQTHQTMSFSWIDSNGYSQGGKVSDLELVGTSEWIATVYWGTIIGGILLSVDSGQTWQTLFSGSRSLYALDFGTPAIGYAVGRGRIVKTVNGGQMWTLQPPLLTNDLRCVDFINADTGWSAGALGCIYRTDDGGESWHLRHTGMQIVYAIDAVSADTIYAAGSGGLILKTVTGGIPPNQASEPKARPVAEAITLGSFPNPFNANTIIFYSLPRAGSVVLRVFDVTGREVFTRNLGMIAAGTHRTTFDAKELSSGVYFARLETPRDAVNHKMVLLR